jgi:hypothetical protein
LEVGELKQPSKSILGKAVSKIKSVLSIEEEAPRPVYVPTPAEEKQLVKLNMMLSACKEARKKKEAIWDRAHEFIHENIQWERAKPKEMSDYTGNILFANVRHKAALVTDNRPMYNVSPTKELPIASVDEKSGETIQIGYEDVEKLKILLEDYGWYHWNLEETVESAAIDAFTYGIGIIKIGYDSEKDFPFGDVSGQRISPYCFYIFPRSGECFQDADGCIEASVMRLDNIDQEFEEKGKFVAPEEDFSEIRYDKEIENNDAEGTGSTFGNGAVSSTGAVYRDTKRTGSVGQYALERAMVYRMYIKDNETISVEEPVLDEQGDAVIDPLTGEVETETVVRKKYPNGRLIIWSNNVVLFDDKNPNKDGKFPYAIFRANTVPGQFWGVGEYEAHHKSQRAWNRLMCQMIDHYNGANSKWMVQHGSLTSGKKLSNKPWEVITYTKTAPKMETPPPLPNDYFQMLSMFRSTIDMESGLHDMSRGERTPGLDKVGIALSLKDSDFTRLRPVIRNFERFISEIGEMCIARILQHNSLSRKYSYSNPDTGQPSVLNIGGFPKDIDLVFKVNVKSNSTLPADKPSRAATAIQLFKDGVLGPETLLKSLDWPNIQEAMQEMSMMNQLKQKVQESEQIIEQGTKYIKQLESENKQLEGKADEAENEAGEAKLNAVITTLKADNKVAQLGANRKKE